MTCFDRCNVFCIFLFIYLFFYFTNLSKLWKLILKVNYDSSENYDAEKIFSYSLGASDDIITSSSANSLVD